MKSSRFFVFFLFIFFFDHSLYSQIKTLDYSLETGALGALGHEMPFWMVSDQFGLFTPDRFNAYGRVGVFSHLSKGKKIDYDYGLQMVDRYGKNNQFYLQQAYARLKLYFFNIQAGSINETFGNQDSSLSSGGLMWSGNARPMPKVSVIVPDYTPIPFTKGYFEFKGGMSHGWFENNQYQRNVWLHHKYYYLQFGGKLPVHIHYGFHHFAQWGGETTGSGKLPHGFKDFIKIFFAKNGGSDAPLSEEINRLGNHLGSRNFGLDISLRKYNVSTYWQTIFEDGSGLAYRNISDGLWGIAVHTKDKSSLISGFVYEFVKTTDQSGTYNDYWELNGQRYLYPVTGGVHKEAGGNDNYFNHGVYSTGWTRYDMTIGTPFITSPALYRGNGGYISNNKVKAHYVALEGTYRKLQYKLRYSYSLNYGTNALPFDPVRDEHSLAINTFLNNALPWGLTLGLAAGLDKGKMSGDNAGLMVSLIKKRF